MCNDTEEWKKLEEESTRCFKIEKEIWRIWPQHSKISKITL